MQTDNKYLKGIAKNTGGTDAEEFHTNNWYLKRIYEATGGLIDNLKAIRVVTNKGTASAETMNKLYIEVSSNTADVYYTVATESGDEIVYSWEKMDDDILDNVSIDWSDIQNKPSTFAPSPHTHSKSDITDFSHTHTESDITNLGSYVKTSDIADNLTTNDATKVLSAKQGKALNDLIGDAITYINM